MAVVDTYVFPGSLTIVLTQLFFPKPQTTFLTCFCRGERRKYAGKKVPPNRGSNSQPPGHESDMLTTEPPGREPLTFTMYHLQLLEDVNRDFSYNLTDLGQRPRNAWWYRIFKPWTPRAKNAGVAFVKGASERNEFLGKK